MKLANEDSAFKIGDTSFRRADYDTSIPEILKSLNDNNRKYGSWASFKGDKRTSAQQAWYDALLENSDLFDRQNSNTNENTNDGVRARTLVPSIAKLGFTDGNNLTAIGHSVIDGTTKDLDPVERLINLDSLSSAFLRQLLKVRVYENGNSKTERAYFAPFLYALDFLLKYDHVPTRHLNYILEGIRPTMTNDDVIKLRDDYQHVQSGKQSFFTYYYQHLTPFLSTNPTGEQAAETLLNEIENLIKQGVTIETFNAQYVEAQDGKYIERFRQVFKNSNGAQYVKRYAQFFYALISARVNRTELSIKQLIKTYKTKEIKTSVDSAFDTHPIIPKGQTLSEFEDYQSEDAKSRLNEGIPDSKLWSGSYRDIYRQFVVGKFINNVGEYGDLITRYLNVSRIISSDKGLYHLRLKPLFAELMKYKTNIWLGVDIPYEYEENNDGEFKTEQTLTEILGISSLNLNAIINKEIRKAHLDDPTVSSTADLVEYYRRKEAQEFYDIVSAKFPKDKTIQILRDIVAYDGRKGSVSDNVVMNQVTHNTNTPGIFEYMLGIAWWYLAEKNVNLYFSYNLRLDSNFMPTGAASGGQGDIEVDYNSFGLLLEATVQNKNSQKAGELEPVIRHTTNLNTRTVNGKPWYGMFVATELDHNVTNIFHAMQWTTLEDSGDKTKSVDGVGIFALSTTELITLLEKDRRLDEKVIEAFVGTLSDDPQAVSTGWREAAIDPLLA